MLQFRIVRNGTDTTQWSSYEDCGCHSDIKGHAEMLLAVNQKRSPGADIDIEWRDTEDVDWPTEIDIPA